MTSARQSGGGQSWMAAYTYADKYSLISSCENLKPLRSVGGWLAAGGLNEVNMKLERRRDAHARAAAAEEGHATSVNAVNREAGWRARRGREGMSGHAQVGVDPGDLCLGDALGQRGEPALGLPVHRVRAPDRLVAVRREEADDHDGVLWDRDLVDRGAVESGDGLGEGEDDVLARSARM